MHNIKLPNFYHFINNLNIKNIMHLNKEVALIYRNYQSDYVIEDLINFKNFCKKSKRIFLIANQIELAIKLKLNGVYIPSFNKKIILKRYNDYKNFIIIGSAHNLKEIRIKEKQNVMQIFLSPLFKDTKFNKKLDVIKFNNLRKNTKKQVIALGGIKKSNLSLLKQLEINGFAAIEFFKENNNNFKYNK